MNKTVFFNKFRRLFGFVLTISLLGNVFAASAQNARISIKMENVPISQVIKEIENQTRYLFINKGVDTKKQGQYQRCPKNDPGCVGTTVRRHGNRLPDR